MSQENTPVLSTLVVDGHVHIYKPYNWAAAVNALIANLTTSPRPVAPAQTVIPVGLLAESQGHRFYKEVLERGSPLIQGALQVEAGPDAGSLIIREAGLIKGYLIAGRQLVTQEKLEVLALGQDVSITNGLSLQETVQVVTAQNAIPVISWSPGKWFFSRGKVVKSFLTTTPPGTVLLGDIGLRPTAWPTPRLMKMADRLGFKMIGGSDSIPLPGEERWIGGSGFQVAGAFNPQTPAASIRALLLNRSATFTPIGRHSSLIAFANRWGRNQLK